uniref:Uncharacterized protein n=1 Tax=Arundo donax TaxID=35708 RepID=A0A0A8XXK4_ARUDO
MLTSLRGELFFEPPR